MKSVSLAKLLATSVAIIGLLAGCAGSDTKDEAAAEQPAQQEAPAQTDAADNSQSTETAEASTDESNSTDASMSSGDSYEVVTGDNLWNISGKNEIYADPYQWPLIYKANRDKINDADLIYSGQVLNIDRAASQSDVDAAVNHAKTRGAWTLGTQEASDKAYLGE